MTDPLPGLKELYFVADGTGRHLFSETYEEHLARIRQVRSKGEPQASAAAPDTSVAVARADTGHGAAKKPPVAPAEGAAAMVGGVPDLRIILIALLYSIGAHGIMTLNDFKSSKATGRWA